MKRTDRHVGFALALVLLTSVCFAAGCARPLGPQPRTEADRLEQVLVGVPDPEMQQRWRDAHAQGQLPALASLPQPKRAVSEREHARVREPRPKDKLVPLPREAVAGIRLFSEKPVREYRGPFTLTKVEHRNLTGRLKYQEEPLVIHYKLPGDGKLVGLAPEAVMTLDLRDDADQSVRKLVDLYDEYYPLVLFYISDGGEKPYERTFERQGLTIRQTEAKEDEDQNHPQDGRQDDGKVEGQDAAAQPNMAVEITYGEQKFELKPGQHRRAKDRVGEVEFFLLTSHRTPPAEQLLAEGDNYHVTLLAYRLAE